MRRIDGSERNPIDAPPPPGRASRRVQANKTKIREAHRCGWQHRDKMPVSEERALAFVRSSIKSAWSLELLLLLRRESQRWWSVAALVQELRGSVPVVNDGLNSLSRAELVARSDEGAYSYRAGSQELDEIVAALAELNARKPLLVLEAIFASPSEKIRSFSDAFLIKRNQR